MSDPNDDLSTLIDWSKVIQCRVMMPHATKQACPCPPDDCSRERPFALPQHPAAPEGETDASGSRTIRVKVTVDTDELREWADRHADAGRHGVAHVLYKAADDGESLSEQAIREAVANRHASLLADLDALRERVRVVEGERDAARREERMRAEDHARAWREVAALTTRAESAEAAHAAGREGDARALVAALKERWDGLPGRLAPHVALDDVRQELRALLAGGGE